MSFTITGSPLTIWTRLTDDNETTIFTASKPTVIVSIGWSETAGGTHTLTIARHAGATEHIIRGAKALAAYEWDAIDTVLRLGQGDTITATSSDDTGDVHMRVSYLAPDSQA